MQLAQKVNWYFVGVYIIIQTSIHLIEKTLALEKYKSRTMGPNGFVGATLLA